MVKAGSRLSGAGGIVARVASDAWRSFTSRVADPGSQKHNHSGFTVYTSGKSENMGRRGKARRGDVCEADIRAAALATAKELNEEIEQKRMARGAANRAIDQLADRLTSDVRRVGGN